MADTEQRTAQIFQDCLDAVQYRGETLDSVLARYPELEDELRPGLENALWLMSRRPVLDPDPAFVRQSRQRLMARIKAQQRVEEKPSWLAGLVSFLRMPPVVLRSVMTLLLVVFLLMGADRVVETTETAIPGDAGYTVKRTVEDLTLAVSNDPGQQIVLHLEYSQRRLAETNALVDQKRYNDATETLNEFEDQVKNAVVSLDEVRDEDTVHKELLAMTISEKLTDHTRQLNTLMTRVPDDSKAAVDEAIHASRTGAVLAQTAIKRLIQLRTPQPGDAPVSPAVGDVTGTSPGATPTEATIFQVFSTPTEEYRIIFSSTEAPPEPTRPGEIIIQPTFPPLGPTLEPFPTETPDYPTPVPTETSMPTRTPYVPVYPSSTPNPSNTAGSNMPTQPVAPATEPVTGILQPTPTP